MSSPSPTIDKVIALAAVLAGAAIPISTAVQNTSAALLVLMFVFLKPDWNQIKHNLLQPFSMMGLIFGVYLVLGTLWTTADLNSAWGFIWKMRAYFIIPVLLYLFSNKIYRNYIFIGFGISSFIVIVISCLSAIFNYPVYKGLHGDWFVFRTHTNHNFFAALLAVGLTSLVLAETMEIKKKAVLLLLIALAGFNILFLVTGRTGQIVFLCMMTSVLLWWNWRRALGILVIASLTLAIVLPRYSTSFENGVASAEADLVAYSQGNANTSIGSRLAWHKNSIKMIMEEPWLGHGTGSFKTEYSRISELAAYAPLSENPHNDYLWLSVELGLPGGLILIGLLLAAAWQGRHLEDPWKWTLYALLLGMGISTIANSFFTDNVTGLAFVILSCALLSGEKRGKLRA
jgi:O-antigen ligase